MGEKMPLKQGRLRRGSVILACFALIEGTFMPAVTDAAFGVQLHNVIWGAIYGLGPFAWHLLFGSPEFGTKGLLFFLFALIAYPFLVFGLTALLLKMACAASRTRAVWTFLLFGISLCLIVPLSRQTEFILQSLPLYVKYVR